MVTSEWILGSLNAKEALNIRERVFVEELGFRNKEVFDEHDALCAHLLVKVDDVPAASARLHPCGDGLCFSFIGVLNEYRGQCLGDLCTRLILYKAQQMGAKTLSANVNAAFVPYYNAFGFTKQKETGDGMVHISISPEDIIWHSACEHS